MKRLLAIWLAFVLVWTGGAAGLVRAEEMQPQSADGLVQEQAEADTEEQIDGADPDDPVEATDFVLPEDDGEPAEEAPAEPVAEEATEEAAAEEPAAEEVAEEAATEKPSEE